MGAKQPELVDSQLGYYRELARRDAAARERVGRLIRRLVGADRRDHLPPPPPREVMDYLIRTHPHLAVKYMALILAHTGRFPAVAYCPAAFWLAWRRDTVRLRTVRLRTVSVDEELLSFEEACAAGLYGLVLSVEPVDFS